jgi:hypothetical protein
MLGDMQILPEKGGDFMKQLELDFPIPDGYKIAFRAWITVKGRRIYAKAYGLRAFPILVKV